MKTQEQEISEIPHYSDKTQNQLLWFKWDRKVIGNQNNLYKLTLDKKKARKKGTWCLGGGGLAEWQQLLWQQCV